MDANEPIHLRIRYQSLPSNILLNAFRYEKVYLMYPTSCLIKQGSIELTNKSIS